MRLVHYLLFYINFQDFTYGDKNRNRPVVRNIISLSDFLNMRVTREHSSLMEMVLQIKQAYWPEAEASSGVSRQALLDVPISKINHNESLPYLY